jgi:DNA repair protein RadA/Sms
VAAVGEVGLGGEVRPVSHLEQRVKEAKRLGFARIIVPVGRAERKKPGGGDDESVAAVRTIGEAMEHLG